MDVLVCSRCACFRQTYYARHGYEGVDAAAAALTGEVLRLPSTGTSGATLRVHVERHEPASRVLDRDAGEALAHLAAAVEALADFSGRLGRKAPT